MYLQICLIELDSQVYGILVGSAVGSVVYQGLDWSPRNISFKLKLFPASPLSSPGLKSHFLLVFPLSHQVDSQSRVNFATLLPYSVVHGCWDALTVGVGDNLQVSQLWHLGDILYQVISQVVRREDQAAEIGE